MRTALRLSFIALTLGALAPEASAQLGRLGERARERAERAAQDRAREAPPPPTAPPTERASDSASADTTETPRRLTPEEQTEMALAAQAERQRAMMNQAAGFDVETGPDYPALDYSSVPLAPVVAYTSVLEEIRIDPMNGRFDVTDFVVVFAPRRDVEGNAVDHTQQVRGRVLLKDPSGTVLFDRYYSGGNDTNPTTSRFETAANPINQREIARTGISQLMLTTASAYTVEFYLDDRLLSRVPIEVAVIGSSDPYSNTPPSYALVGDWQTMGFADFEVNIQNREPYFQWNWYHQLLDPERTREGYEARFELRKDGRVLGRETSQMGRSRNREFRTQRFTHVDRARQGTTAATVRQSDITDGDYEVRMVIETDARNGGSRTRTARFTIRDGVFVPHGDQVRQGTPEADYIEGMNRAFFYPFPESR